jgi:glyoxylase-like metal-dependent hydrolase (beta-lactamase superfamily II)
MFLFRPKSILCNFIPFLKKLHNRYYLFSEKGDQSCVLIDTLESHEAAQEALVDIKKVINDKPIDAIILTHFHADHTGEFLTTNFAFAV